MCSIHLDGKGDTEEFRSRFRDVENRLQNTGYQVRIRKKKGRVSHIQRSEIERVGENAHFATNESKIRLFITYFRLLS